MSRIMRESLFSVQLICCVGLGVFYLYDYLLRVSPSVLSRGVIEAYQLSFSSYGLLCTSYYLIYVPLQLVIGFLVDRIQLFYLMTFSLLLSALGCYLFANAHAFWIAEVGRIIMGMGAGFIFIILLKTISLHVLQKQFSFVIGTLMGVGMLGGLIMDMIFVFVMQAWGWRLTCYLIVVIGLLFSIFSLLYSAHVPDLAESQNKPSLTEDIKYYKDLLLDKQLWIRGIIGVALYLPIAGFVESWGIRFLNETSQLSLWLAAIDMSLFFLGFAIGAPILGWYYDRSRQYQLILTTGAIGMTILLSIVLYVPELSALNIALHLFLFGFFSSSLVILFALNQEKINGSNAGKIFGAMNFILTLAGGGAWLVGILLNVLGPYSVPYYTTSKYQLAFLIFPAALLLAVFLSFYVRDYQDSRELVAHFDA